MEGNSLLQDFAITLLVAGVVGGIFRKVGLSAVVGFLIAGLIVGPHTPPFVLVSDVARIQALSELGLVFLMFFVGLGLSLKRIQRMGLPVLIATTVTAFTVFLLSQAFSRAMGWNEITSLVFAAMFMTSSSAIIVKMLVELGLTHERFAQNAQGVTVLEDVVAVVMLTIIGSKLQLSGAEDKGVGTTMYLLLGFTVLMVVLGLIFVPRLLKKVGHSSNADLTAILVCGLVFSAGLAAVNAGFSVALGAFLLGVVIAETHFKGRIEKRLAGLQDMFSAIFFVSIGMLIDPRVFLSNAALILGVTAFAIMARILASSFGLLVSGAPIAVAASSALILTPIGEFSYIIAQLGVTTGAVPDTFYAVAVGSSLITAILAPMFAKVAERFGLRVDAVQPAPMRRLVDGYRTFLDVAESRASKVRVWKLTRRRISLTFMEILMLAGLFGFADPLRAGLAQFLQKAGFSSTIWEVALMSFIVVIGIILIVAIWRTLHALSMIYAEVITPRALQKPGRARMVQLALQAISTLGLALLVLYSFPVHSTGPWITALLLIIPAAAIMLFWKPLIRLHSKFEISLAEAVANAVPPGSRMGSVSGSKRQHDWGLDIAEVSLPDSAACAGQTIKELAIRSKFGCSVLEVERQGYVISNPRPEFAVYSGDRILLFGDEAQINSARTFLSQEKEAGEQGTFDEAVLETTSVPPEARVLGKSLAELQVSRATGVQVVGVERNGARVLNPSGSERMLSGDLLLLIGTRQEIRRFEEWMVGGT